MSIYIPKDINEAMNLASLLTTSQQKAQELLILHATFGAHFGYDMGKVLEQAYMIKGKPALKADALAGICRRSGLMRFLQITEWTDRICTVIVARNDEPQDMVHTFSFTWEMAEKMGLTRNQSWLRMPQQMLRSRMISFALWALFPDALAGIYSVDEMADSMPLSDDERFQLSAHSIGETDVATHHPQPQRAPQQSRAPQPQRAPQQSRPPQAQPPKMRVGEVTPSLTYNNPNNLRTACEFNEIPLAEANACMQRLGFHADKASAEERKQFFYEWLLSDTLRNSELKPNWWRNVGESKHIIAQLHQEFPVLQGLGGREIGQTLGDQFFWESVKIASCYSGDLLDTARVYIEQWSRQGANQLSPTTILGLAG